MEMTSRGLNGEIKECDTECRLNDETLGEQGENTRSNFRDSHVQSVPRGTKDRVLFTCTSVCPQLPCIAYAFIKIPMKF